MTFTSPKDPAFVLSATLFEFLNTFVFFFYVFIIFLHVEIQNCTGSSYIWSSTCLNEKHERSRFYKKYIYIYI